MRRKIFQLDFYRLARVAAITGTASDALIVNRRVVERARVLWANEPEPVDQDWPVVTSCNWLLVVCMATWCWKAVLGHYGVG